MKRHIMSRCGRSAAVAAVVLGTALFGGASVGAAPSADVTQTINPGTLVTSILDASRNNVATPSFAMSAKSLSVDCQYGGNASTGTFGSSTQRVYVTNGGAANNGFTLTLAATNGATSTWSNAGATNKFDFNDASGTNAGCNDGADTDTQAGQLTVDPSASTLTTDCAGCTLTGVSKGSMAAFSQGTTDNITLVNAAASSNDIWRGYATGIGMSQTVPAETPSDSYSINFTLTATAQ